MTHRTAPRHRAVWALPAFLLALLFLAGCGTASVSEGVVAGGAPQAAPRAPLEDAAGDATAERQVARTAYLALTVPDVAAAATALRAVAAAQGGFIASEDLVSATTSRAWSTVVLSVPSDSLDAVLDEASKVGEVTQRTVTAEDVTVAVADVDARVRTLQESIARLRELMDRAGTVAEIAAVEKELTSRQAELESLLAQQKALSTRVANATVTVSLVTPAQAGTNPFLEGLRRGWEALQSSIVAIIVIAGGAIPFLAVLAAIVVPLWWWRRSRRAARSASAKGPDAELPAAAKPDGE